MNELIDYKIKVEISKFQLELFLQSMQADYIELRNGNYIEQSCKDLLIGINIFKSVKKKYDMDMLRNRMEGYVRKKPYAVKLNKLECLWLYKYIEMAELIELYDINANIIGRHITEFL